MLEGLLPLLIRDCVGATTVMLSKEKGVQITIIESSMHNADILVMRRFLSCSAIQLANW